MKMTRRFATRVGVVRFLSLSAIAFGFCWGIADAATATSKSGILDDIQGSYQTAMAGWLTISMSWARLIFAGLIVLEITWAITETFIRTNSLDDFVSSITVRIIMVGFAVTILSVAPTIITPAITDFMNIGSSIGGGSLTASTPDDIAHQGWKIAGAMNDATEKLSWGEFGVAVIPQEIGSLMVFMSYDIVACQLMLSTILISLISGGGAFLLGFIGSRWTMPFAERYPAMLIASGLQLVTIKLIVGLGNTLAGRWIAIFSGHQHVAPMTFLSVGCETVIYAIIAFSVPLIMMMFAGASPALSASSLVQRAASLTSLIPGGSPAPNEPSAPSSNMAAIERAAQ